MMEIELLLVNCRSFIRRLCVF